MFDFVVNAYLDARAGTQKRIVPRRITITTQVLADAVLTDGTDSQWYWQIVLTGRNEYGQMVLTRGSSATRCSFPRCEYVLASEFLRRAEVAASENNEVPTPPYLPLAAQYRLPMTRRPNIYLFWPLASALTTIWYAPVQAVYENNEVDSPHVWCISSPASQEEK